MTKEETLLLPGDLSREEVEVSLADNLFKWFSARLAKPVVSKRKTAVQVLADKYQWQHVNKRSVQGFGFLQSKFGEAVLA